MVGGVQDIQVVPVFDELLLVVALVSVIPAMRALEEDWLKAEETVSRDVHVEQGVNVLDEFSSAVVVLLISVAVGLPEVILSLLVEKIVGDVHPKHVAEGLAEVILPLLVEKTVGDVHPKHVAVGLSEVVLALLLEKPVADVHPKHVEVVMEDLQLKEDMETLDPITELPESYCLFRVEILPCGVIASIYIFPVVLANVSLVFGVGAREGDFVGVETFWGELAREGIPIGIVAEILGNIVKIPEADEILGTEIFVDCVHVKQVWLA